MTIRASKAMLPALMKNALFSPGLSKIFAVYDGPIPTKAEIEALYLPGKTTISSATLHALGTRAGNTYRGSFVFSSDLQAERISQNFYRWETSTRNEEMTVSSNGAVRWFFFAVCQNGMSGPENNSDLFHIIVGTVDNTDNAADVNIVNGILGGAANYLLNDLEINYKI